jgi:hypothetical protein
MSSPRRRPLRTKATLTRREKKPVSGIYPKILNIDYASMPSS